MRKKTRKLTKEVAKFGGTEQLGSVKFDGHLHEASTVETQSQTRLEDDVGFGNAAVIRRFTFAMNPEIFKLYPPTKQDLFNQHLKGIEIALWKDGLKVLPTVEPRLKIDEKRMQYEIFIGATPQRGHILHERPQTLTEIAHG